MICKNCGKDNNEGLKFCTQCGTKLEEIIVYNDESNNIVENNIVDKVDSNEEIKVDNSNSNTEYVNNVDYNNVDKDTVVKSSNIEKKSNTGLIVALVIVIVAVIIGISVFILWKVNSNKVSGNNVESNNSINTNNTNNTNNNSNSNNNNSNTKTSNSNNKDIVTKYDNYNIDIDLSMEVSGMSVDASFTGTVDQKNQVEYLKMSMNMLGMNMSSETYTDLKNGITYTSEPLTGSWIKETGASQMVDLDEFLNELKNMKNVEKIDNDHFKIKITSEDIKGMLDASDVDLNSFDGEISADVFTNNGFIEEIKYDFGNISEELGTFKMNIKLSNYNKAGSITIPEEVIKSATEE